MKFGVALATLGLVAQGSAFVPSFNARQTFVGQAVSHAAATPASTRQTRQVLKAVAAASAVETGVLTKVRAPNNIMHGSMSAPIAYEVLKLLLFLPCAQLEISIM